MQTSDRPSSKLTKPIAHTDKTDAKVTNFHTQTITTNSHVRLMNYALSACAYC